jgi:hypothetical protein
MFLHPSAFIYLTLFWKANPKLINPKTAIKLKSEGNGFPLLIALGMDDPAKTTEARRASSTP